MTAWPATTEYAGSSAHLTELAAIAAGQQDALAQLYHLTRTAVYGLSLSYLKTPTTTGYHAGCIRSCVGSRPDIAPPRSPHGLAADGLPESVPDACGTRSATPFSARQNGTPFPQQETGLTTEERTLLQHRPPVWGGGAASSYCSMPSPG